MEIRPKTKILLLAVAICIAFPVIFGEVLVSLDIGHECHGNHGGVEASCQVCLKIELARSLLKTIKMVSAGLTLAALLHLFTRSKLEYSEQKYFNLSPILLKVRINT